MRSTEKFVITPEMIDEGSQILQNQFDALPSMANDIALAVLKAMMSKSPELIGLASIRVQKGLQST